MPSKSFWGLIAFLSLGPHVVAVAQQPPSHLWSLPPAPPLKQSIWYVGKTTTTDFRGLGMGQHLQYFPAFGLTTPRTGLRTNCVGCFEITPNFENFKHHITGKLDRTFSPDAGGEPRGVKTAGGDSSWDVFTLPDGRVGRSGSTYDTSVCDNTNNFVNQIRINTSGPLDFCLNLITDNTNGKFDPDVRLEARSDDVDLRLSTALDADGQRIYPEFTFDGQTDMYTFRYMGMQEGDRIKIRIGDTPDCDGAGLGGIVVSHIDTCTPPPGTCIPTCAGTACGDDGCGGTCGSCPRADRLRKRTGYVSVFRNAGGTYADPDVDSVVDVGDSLRALLDDLETSLGNDFESKLTQTFNQVDINVQNHRLGISKTVQIDTVAQSNATLNFTFALSEIHADFNLTPEAGGSSETHVSIVFPGASLSGNYDPETGLITDANAITEEPTIATDVSGGVVGHPWDELDDVEDLFGDAFSLTESLQGLIETKLEAHLTLKLQARLNDVVSGLNGLNLPVLGLLPETVVIGGTDYGPDFREILAYPPAGQSFSIEYDGEDYQTVEIGNPAIEIEQEASLAVNVTGHFQVTASLRKTIFPPIRGEIDAYLDSSGDYTIDGWTCAEELGESLDVGVFSDGSALKVVKAELEETDTDVIDECGTTGTFDLYRYSMSLTSTELESTNVWDNRISVIAGLGGFERELGEVSRTEANLWFANTAQPASVDHNYENNEFIGDFNGDLRDDYMWLRDGSWYVALANSSGTAFNTSSTPWLASSNYPNMDHFNENSQFVADFNGDSRDDFLWHKNGDWYVATAKQSNDGFNTPEIWFASSAQPTGGVEHSNPSSQHVGDFNFDGKADFFWHRNGKWYMALANYSGTGFTTSNTPWLDSSAYPSGDHSNPGSEFIADFNSDAKRDYMWLSDGNWYVALTNSSGTGFNTMSAVWLASSTYPTMVDHHNEGSQFTADFNFDGRDDLLWHQNGDWYVATAKISNDGFNVPTIWLDEDAPPFHDDGHSNPGNQFVADFDGDGYHDLMWHRDGWYVARSNGAGFEEAVLWFGSGASPSIDHWSDSQHVGDFTGDNIPDFMWYKNDSDKGWYVAETLLSPPPPPGGGC